MASTGKINASNQYITFKATSNVENLTNNSFDTTNLSSNGGSGYMTILIDDRLIEYGTINKVTLTYTCYGSRTSWAAATIRTGCINASGSLNWQVTHNEAVGKGSSKATTFTDEFTPVRSNTGQYQLIIGAVNNIAALNLEVNVYTIIITIEYTAASYTVTWKNYDGTTLETDTGVSSGTTPTYNGATPTKPQDAQYTYAFSGWSPAVGAITADTTYTAQFTATVRKYPVEILYDENAGTVTGAVSGSYEYGTKLTLTAVPKAGYSFNGWVFDYMHDESVNPLDNPITFTVLGEETVLARMFVHTNIYRSEGIRQIVHKGKNGVGKVAVYKSKNKIYG